MTKNLIVVAAMLATALIQYILMRFVLYTGGKAELGYYSYAVSIISPIVIFFNFGIRNLLSTLTVNGVSVAGVYFLKIIGFLCALGIIAFIPFVLPSSIPLYIVFFVAFLKLLDSLSDLSVSFYYFKKDMKTYILSSLMKLCLLLLGVWLSIILNYDMSKSALLLGIFYLIGQLYDFKTLIKEFTKPIIEFVIIKKGLLLGTASVIASLIIMYPRIHLGRLGEYDILAELAVLIFLVSLINMMWNSYLMLKLSYLSQAFIENKPVTNFILKNYALPLLLVFLLSLLIAITFANDFIILLFDETFKYEVVDLVISAVLALASMLQALSNNILVAKGLAKSLTLINIFFLVVIVLCFSFLFSDNLSSALIIITAVYCMNFIINFYIGFFKNDLH